MPEPTVVQADAAADSTSTSERRSQDRQRSTRQVLIRAATRISLQAFRPMVYDVSPVGLGLLTDEPLQPGTILALGLPAKKVGTSYVLSAHVVHATPHVDGVWHIGCALSRRLADSEIASLL
jgi:PilZ domain